MYDEDCLSERSYDGPDAKDYYRLEDIRESRKEDLMEEKEEQQELKQRRLDEEDTIVKKIQEAIEAVRNAESRGDAPEPFNSVASKCFDLYCVDHVKHSYVENYSTKYVEFYYCEPKTFIAKQPPNSDTKINGHIYLNNHESVDFEKVCLPKETGPKKYSITDKKGKYEFAFQFISNHYLIATVPREFVFLDAAVDPLAPEMFTMYGVRYDFQRLKKKNLHLLDIPRLNRYEWKMP